MECWSVAITSICSNPDVTSGHRKMRQLETTLKFLRNTMFLVNFGQFLFSFCISTESMDLQKIPKYRKSTNPGSFQGGRNEPGSSHLDSSLPIGRKHSVSWMFDSGASPGRLKNVTTRVE